MKALVAIIGVFASSAALASVGGDVGSMSKSAQTCIVLTNMNLDYYKTATSRSVDLKREKIQLSAIKGIVKAIEDRGCELIQVNTSINPWGFQLGGERDMKENADPQARTGRSLVELLTTGTPVLSVDWEPNDLRPKKTEETTDLNASVFNLKKCVIDRKSLDDGSTSAAAFSVYSKCKADTTRITFAEQIENMDHKFLGFSCVVGIMLPNPFEGIAGNGHPGHSCTTSDVTSTTYSVDKTATSRLMSELGL